MLTAVHAQLQALFLLLATVARKLLVSVGGLKITHPISATYLSPRHVNLKVFSCKQSSCLSPSKCIVCIWILFDRKGFN